MLRLERRLNIGANGVCLCGGITGQHSICKITIGTVYRCGGSVQLLVDCISPILVFGSIATVADAALVFPERLITLKELDI